MLQLKFGNDWFTVVFAVSGHKWKRHCLFIW